MLSAGCVVVVPHLRGKDVSYRKCHAKGQKPYVRGMVAINHIKGLLKALLFRLKKTGRPGVAVNMLSLETARKRSNKEHWQEM